MSGTPSHPTNGAETYRYALDTRHVSGGRCSLLVRRVGSSVQVLFHCDPHTGAILTAEQVHALAGALLEASGGAAS